MKQINIMRIFRLVMGVIVIVQAYYTDNWLLAIPGTFFLLMAAFNLGCGPAGCGVPKRKERSVKQSDEVIFEEINEKK